jgi:hypothetical protein
VPALTRASVSRRAWWAAVLSLVLALRLLTPAGFMPAFEAGRLTIVECPGSGAVQAMPPMRGMHHDRNQSCQSCPHATATGAGLVDAGPAAFGRASVLAFPRLLLLTFVLPARSIAHDRPPAIGPPIPA